MSKLPKALRAGARQQRIFTILENEIGHDRAVKGASRMPLRK